METALKKNEDRILRAGISLTASGASCFITASSGLFLGSWDWALILFLGAALFAAVYWLTGAVRDDLTVMLLLALLLGAGMVIRAFCLNHVTADYNDFLQHWVERFRLLGVRAFAEKFADYNMPYLYFLYVISKIPINDLYLIKALSIVFDLLNVVMAVKLALHFKLDVNRQMIVAGGVWLAPTMWLNSGFWGQCDSIYAFFVLCALYFALKNRPSLSVAMAALAFSFKLQTIFFLPLYAVLMIAKRVRWRDAPVFPAVYFASILPAVLLGKPLGEILNVYSNQVELYDDRLNLNSPSAYALLPAGAPHDVFFPIGVILAFVFMGFIICLAWRGRDRLDDKGLALCAFALCAGVPWLLPSMHDRYFYLADVLSILMAVLIPRRWYLAPMAVFASYGGYHAYLFLQYLPFGQLALPALLMGAAAAIVTAELYRRLFPTGGNGVFAGAGYEGEVLEPDEI